MNNHLSYRWPSSGPAAPEQHTAPPQPRPKAKRTGGLTIFLLVLAGIAAVALLSFAAFSGIMYLLERINDNADVPPAISFHVPDPSPAATDSSDSSGGADALPWGSPDPDTTISLSAAAAEPLTPENIYTRVLSSVVCVQTGYTGHMGYGVGSGIILTQSGYIVTNYHVIDGGSSLDVMLLSTEELYPARLIGYDKELDIAVLKIDAPDLVPASLGDSDDLAVGSSVYAIGNPMGYLYGSMSDGIVSALTRQVDIQETSMNLIQLSIPLNSGNSGGPVVDVCGQVVGIAVAKLTGLNDDTVVEGIGLAIPITDTLPFINHIIHTGKSWRPALGILCLEHTSSSGQKGILVDSTTAGTPADGKLMAGDLIIAANGREITSLYELTRALYETGVGNTIELTILRSFQQITVSITLYDMLTE